MTKHILLIGLALVVGGSATGSALAPGQAAVIEPREAIELAEYAAPGTVPGTFRMLVRETGREGWSVYLHSEYLYSDPRNLTVNIDRSTTEALARRLGSPPDKYFQGKWIEVRGEAQRTTIRLASKPAGRQYFQTNIRVTDPDQIVLAAPPAS